MTEKNQTNLKSLQFLNNDLNAPLQYSVNPTHVYTFPFSICLSGQRLCTNCGFAVNNVCVLSSKQGLKFKAFSSLFGLEPLLWEMVGTYCTESAVQQKAFEGTVQKYSTTLHNVSTVQCTVSMQ